MTTCLYPISPESLQSFWGRGFSIALFRMTRNWTGLSKPLGSETQTASKHASLLLLLESWCRCLCWVHYIPALVCLCVCVCLVNHGGRRWEFGPTRTKLKLLEANPSFVSLGDSRLALMSLQQTAWPAALVRMWLHPEPTGVFFVPHFNPRRRVVGQAQQMRFFHLTHSLRKPAILSLVFVWHWNGTKAIWTCFLALKCGVNTNHLKA